MWDIDWGSLLVPSKSVAEIAVRGTVVYLALFLSMRFLPRRAIGGMGPSDLLIVVLIADAVQNAMADGYESITEGLVLAAVIFGWATLIDWLDYRLPHWHIAQAGPRALISNGQLVRDNMKREQVSEDELMSQLRQHGLDSPRDVVAAYVEGDGRFSILIRGGIPTQLPPQSPRGT